MARKNALISVAHDNAALTFTVGEAGSFVIDTAELSDDIRMRALLHGIVQKVSDAAAIAKADLPKDPKKAAAAKFEAMKSVADRLTAPDGEWSKRSGDGSGPVQGVIYRAFEEWVETMAKAAKKPVPASDAIRARYDAMDRAGQLALRNVPAIAEIIERIKSERGGKAVNSVDTDSLLGDLGL